MAGRKRIPTALKLIKGTAQPCRMNKNEPAPDPAPPRVTKWLPDEQAKKYFLLLMERLERVGLASKTFQEMLGLAAQRMAEIDALNKVITEEGSTYTATRLDKNGVMITEQIKAHPAVAQRSEAMRHLQSLLAEFGLSPAEISKVSKLDLNNKPNKFGDL
jgi:P27 family predicted phage terminase small subunit